MQLYTVGSVDVSFFRMLLCVRSSHSLIDSGPVREGLDVTGGGVRPLVVSCRKCTAVSSLEFAPELEWWS
jgi:hypothetical protein